MTISRVDGVLDTFHFFSAHGVDRVEDFGAGDVATVTRNINGTGIETLEDVAARISDGMMGHVSISAAGTRPSSRALAPTH